MRCGTRGFQSTRNSTRSISTASPGRHGPSPRAKPTSSPPWRRSNISRIRGRSCARSSSSPRPGGWVVVTTPNQLSVLSLATLITKRRFSAFQDAHYPAHRTALLEIDLRRAAGECGLELVEVLYSHAGRVPFTPWHYPLGLARQFPRALSDNLLIIGRRPRREGSPLGMTRALFVNSGMARPSHVRGADAAHRRARCRESTRSFIDLSRDLTGVDRVIRRLCSLSFAPRTGPMANLDLRRWREEMNVGWLAARRIANAKRQRSFRRAALLYAAGGVRQHLVDETDARDCLPRLHAAPGQPRSGVPARPRQLLREHRARRAGVPRRIGHRRNLGMGRARPGRAVSRLCVKGDCAAVSGRRGRVRGRLDPRTRSAGRCSQSPSALVVYWRRVSPQRWRGAASRPGTKGDLRTRPTSTL